MSPVKPISQVPMQFETRLNKRLIQSLIETKSEWRASEFRLSLYIPLEKSANNLREVHIQLGNLKRKAMLELERREVSPEDQESHGQVSFHTNSNPGSGGHGSAYFGYGSGQGDGKLMKQEIQHFFQAIDHGVHSMLPKKNLPLVLAGVGYLLPIYREVSKYPQLMAEEIIGNPDSQDKIEDLHGRANSLFQHLEKEECNRASHIFKENLATGRGASGVTDVVPSAFYGRLTHLFLEAGKVQWGIFDKASGKINLQNSYVPGAVDLANLACVHVLHGGKVYALTREEMPNNGDFAALCRD